jgi:hypothetical protein
MIDFSNAPQMMDGIKKTFYTAKINKIKKLAVAEEWDKAKDMISRFPHNKFIKAALYDEVQDMMRMDGWPEHELENNPYNQGAIT